MAAALIVLTVLGTNGWWHLADDDPDCLLPAAVHNHSTHYEQVRSQAPRSAVEHCAICHWLQSFRSDGARIARFVPVAIAPQQRQAVLVQSLRAPILFDIPSRAPPA